MIEFRPIFLTTTALSVALLCGAIGLDLASGGVVAAVAVSLGNLLALDALVRRSSRAVAGGELPALAGLIVQGKLLVTAGLLAGLGALIGPSPVIAGFTLVTVCFTLAVGGLAFASLVSPVMESV